MEQFYSVLLNVWREACRHIELSESTPLITSLLQKDLTLDQVLVKRVFFESRITETVAIGFPRKELEFTRRRDCSDRELKRLKQLFNEQNVCFCQAGVPSVQALPRDADPGRYRAFAIL